MPFVICEKALLDIGPEKNGTIEPSFRGTDLSNALISVKYSPFGPQNRDFGRKTTEREKSQDCVAEELVTSELVSARIREKYRENSARRGTSAPNFAANPSPGWSCTHDLERTLKSYQGITGNLAGT